MYDSSMKIGLYFLIIIQYIKSDIYFFGRIFGTSIWLFFTF